MEVAAVKATEEPREGRERQKARKAASQIVRTGERNLSSTLWKKWGCLRCQHAYFRVTAESLGDKGRYALFRHL